MIKTRADLFEAAAKMVRMCDDAGIGQVWKWNGTKTQGGTVLLHLDIDSYEFPLAIVEGKPVFVGDELYSKGSKFVVGELIDGYFCEFGYRIKGHGISHLPDNCSWNPSKPKTVLVEIPLEDAKIMAFTGTAYIVSAEIGNAIQKALNK